MSGLIFLIEMRIYVASLPGTVRGNICDIVISVHIVDKYLRN